MRISINDPIVNLSFTFRQKIERERESERKSSSFFGLTVFNPQIDFANHFIRTLHQSKFTQNEHQNTKHRYGVKFCRKLSAIYALLFISNKLYAFAVGYLCVYNFFSSAIMCVCFFFLARFFCVCGHFHADNVLKPLYLHLYSGC